MGIAAAICTGGRQDESEVSIALRAAASWGGQEQVRRLLASTFASPHSCEGALCEAASRGYTDVVAELLRARASADSCSSGEKTALHCACEQGQEETAKLLLSGGAALHAKDATCRTPCDLAREQDFGIMAKRLEAFYSEFAAVS